MTAPEEADIKSKVDAISRDDLMKLVMKSKERQKGETVPFCLWFGC